MLSSLPSPEGLRTLADQGRVPSHRPAVNSHIHLPPNFSAFESVPQALDLARQQNVRVLGASNYYDYSVYRDFAREAKGRGIFPLFGIEIIVLDENLARRGVRVNDPKNPGKMYLCGKGMTRFHNLTPEGRRILDLIRLKDSTRMAEMVDKMAVHFANHGYDTNLSAPAVVQGVVERHGVPAETVVLQERHVAQAFQEWLFRKVPVGERPKALGLLFGATGPQDPASLPDCGDHVAVQNALRDQLMKVGRPAYVEETFVDFSQARRLILEMGGIPCYPTLADGASQPCEFETPVESLLDQMKTRDLHCAEFIPTRNTPEVLAHYATALREQSIVLTAGTEHNTLSLDPIEPTCVKGQPIPEPLKELFWEGACVAAAHQILTLRGETGYVDPEGRLHPGYSSREERIADFRRLGAAAIQAYFEAARDPYPETRTP